MNRTLSLLISGVLVGGSLMISGCSSQEEPPAKDAPTSSVETQAPQTGPAGPPTPNTQTAGPPASKGKKVTTPSGLQYEDLVVGTGDTAATGNKVTVHYTGWLTNGKKFDSSKDRGEPFEFTLGAGEVIKGWDEGVAGMKVGGKRKLGIPPELGYGSRAMGDAIPANSTLVFEVDLLGVGK